MTRHIKQLGAKLSICVDLTSHVFGEVCFQLKHYAKKKGEGLKLQNWFKFLRNSHPELLSERIQLIKKLGCFFPLANDTQSFAWQSARNDNNVRSTVKNLVTYCPSALVSCKNSTPHPSPLPDGERECLATWLLSCTFQVSVILNLVQDLDETLKHRGQSDVQGDVRRKLGKLCAFTLAEVLITLGIIGVVAAVTMPTVIAKHQKTQAVTQLKATYSLLSQALTRAKADYGPFEDWNIVNGKTFTETYLKPYIKIIKEYAPSDFPSDYNMTCNTTRSAYDCIYYGGFYYSYKYILANGAMIVPQQATINGNDTITIIIDINGLKGPNKYSRDLFFFNLDKKGIIPYGTGLTSGQESDTEVSRASLMDGENTRCCTKDGLFCAGVIMMDSWQIKDDYPW